MDLGNKSYPESERVYLESIDLEIEKHKGEIERLQKIKNAILNKPAEIIKPQKNSKSSESRIHNNSYPMSGDKQDKVLSILKTEGRVLLQREIEDTIKDIEGTQAAQTLKSFYYVLNDKMLKNGLVAFLRVADSYKYAFYALPGWLDENKKIKPDYLPDEKTWGNFPESKRKKIETDKWKLYVKK
jgi:hypothetical protein